ncbi:unnamed protein product, partial [Tetraodon nigroviridis]
QEETAEPRGLPDQLPREERLHARAPEEDAAAGDLRLDFVPVDQSRRGARHGDAVFLLGARTGQRAGAHRVGQQPHGAAGQRQGEEDGRHPGARFHRRAGASAFLTRPPSPGGGAALVSERREVAPRLRDVVDARRTVGGLPGRRAEGVWEQPVAVAPRQTRRRLHSGAGTGKWGPHLHRRLLRLWNSPDFAPSSSGRPGGTLRRLAVLRGGDVGPPPVVAGPDRRRHPQPGVLRQPPPGRRPRLVRGGGGAPRRRLQLPLRALSLKKGADSGEHGDQDQEPVLGHSPPHTWQTPPRVRALYVTYCHTVNNSEALLW